MLSAVFAIGYLAAHWPWVVGSVIALAGVNHALSAREERSWRELGCERRAERLAAQASEQDALWAAGDVRGVYGSFPPASVAEAGR